MSKRALLVISCSSVKRPTEVPTPAMEVYDGPQFRGLKNRGVPNQKLDVWIVSAKYGLIHAHHEIEYYDQLMSPLRAMQLRAQVREGIRRLVESGDYDKAFCNLGRVYMMAVEDALTDAPIPVGHARGGIGTRMGMTLDWVEAALQS